MKAGPNLTAIVLGNPELQAWLGSSFGFSPFTPPIMVDGKRVAPKLQTIAPRTKKTK